MPEKGTDTANTISDAACPSQTLSLFDRYHNIRGPQEARHDREEARTHAADIVAVLRAQLDPAQFAQAFVRKFLREPLLGLRVLRIFHDFFREPTSPGFLVYEEQLAANIPAGRSVRAELQREVQRSHRVVSLIFPIPEFYGLAAAIDDSCDWERIPKERIPKLTEEYWQLLRMPESCSFCPALHWAELFCEERFS